MSVSTALLNTRTTKKITTETVTRVLAQIVEADPDHVDPRTSDGLMPRYVHRGRPNCLVATVLSRLGFSLGVLRALDEEYPTGELRHAGVQVATSRHPALRRIDPAARALLAHLQRQQDRGWAWGRIVRDALTPARFFAGRDRRERPWLYE